MISVKAAIERALKVSRKIVNENDKVFVAVSGGKDSAAALYVLNELRKEKNFELKAIHIELGFIKVTDIVKELTKMLNVELHIVDLKDYGIDIPKASKLLKVSPCSICGTVRRYLLNKVPRKLGATKVATGHHADDIIMFFIKDLAIGGLNWLSKLEPITYSTHPKILTRIRPLFEVTVEETKAIADELNLPYTSAPCPLAKKAEWFKVYFKDFASKIGKKNYAFKIQIVRNISKILNSIQTKVEKEEFKECKICGEPTNLEICRFCKIREKLKISKINGPGGN